MRRPLLLGRVAQLGIGSTSSTNAPVRVDLGGWSEIAAAQDHTCATLSGGARRCWGRNGSAQLGTGGTEDRSNTRPVDAPGGDPLWSTLATGWFHTCGLTRDRQLACWGGNSRSASAEPLGVESVTRPKLVDDARDWAAVAAGGFHSCALKSDGSIWCWGMNESGELGLGDAADRADPAAIPMSGWTALGAGSFHTCAIRGDGELWCWGGGANGQLGVGTRASDDSSIPLRVEIGSLRASTQWRAIAGGMSHSCGLQDDGSLWCWGRNDHGQLGVGDTENRFEPARVDVPGKDEWIRIGAGREHTCAIRSDRSLWCWGENANGQIGIGRDANPITRPARVCLPAR